ncbi:MAG: aminopeptidase [Alistipes sp.]|nr:aminopeptidase [Alistipes sp.]
MRRYIFTTLFALFAIVACTPEQSADKRFDEGVSKELAEWRKATISDVEYDLVFDLVENSGVVRISFALDVPQDVVIDFRNTELVADIFVPGEGLPREAALHNEHIIIPSYQTKAGKNSVGVLFRLDNQSLNRRNDFLYTLLVPDRARTLFPCFDQPDMKATYRLKLTVPKSWVAVSNTAIEGVEELDDKKTITFAPTEPLSTYLFSFVAGEFEQRTYDDGVHRFTAYYRESDPKRLAQLPTIFEQVASSLEWLEEFTGIDYPFAKYDFVILPGFQYGGMEHTGATLYNDTQMFLSENPTPDEELRRIQLIAHETAHMWFGDYVTMAWFDDVWTKEVFANYFAARITEPLFPDINHRLNWLKSYTTSSLAEDLTLGTTSIRQPLDNLRNAGLVYGNIIYCKAPIMLEKMVDIMGEAAFRNAVREYLATYAYGNATWDDLVAIFDRHTEADIAEFSRVWVNEKSLPYISFKVDGKRLTIVQSDIYERDIVWPQKFDIEVVTASGKERHTIKLYDKSVDIEAADDIVAVLPNVCGRGYGFFSLDYDSKSWLVDNLMTVEDESARMSLLLTLHSLYDAGVLGDSWWQCALLDVVRKEQNPLILSLAIGYLPATWRVEGSEADEQELLALAETHPVLSARRQLWRALYTMAESESVVSEIYLVWERGEHPLLSVDDYMSMAYELAIRYPDRYDYIEKHQRERIADADRRSRFDYIVRGATSDAEALDALFEELLEPANRRTEPWAQATLALINHPLRGESSVKYIRPALEELQEVQRTGDIFFPRNWVGAALSSHRSEAAYCEVVDFLEDNPDYPQLLKNKILQAAHTLYRVNGCSAWRSAVQSDEDSL